MSEAVTGELLGLQQTHWKWKENLILKEKYYVTSMENIWKSE